MMSNKLTELDLHLILDDPLDDFKVITSRPTSESSTKELNLSCNLNQT